MKLGIVVGHQKTAKGAYSPWLQASEYDWNSELSEVLMQVPSTLKRKVFFRDGVGISGAYNNSNNWGSAITVELHFNSSDNELATGTAALYYPGSARGRQLAKLMVDEMRKALGLQLWPSGTAGVVTPRQASGVAENGLANLRAGRAPATLLEPFFGSNQNDCLAAQANRQAYAESIITAAERMLTGS